MTWNEWKNKFQLATFSIWIEGVQQAAYGPQPSSKSHLVNTFCFSSFHRSQISHFSDLYDLWGNFHCVQIYHADCMLCILELRGVSESIVQESNYIIAKCGPRQTSKVGNMAHRQEDVAHLWSNGEKFWEDQEHARLSFKLGTRLIKIMKENF